MEGFAFKQFTVRQERCAMKVGTDGVLLGAWCDVEHAKTILDIGTGTGLIALMAAQRNPSAHIDAVEIDSEAATQAAENVANSPFSAKIRVICDTIQNFSQHAQTYDALVCNPPYFVNSLKCPQQERSTARHTDTLSFDDLLKVATKLLAKNGTFSIILPTSEANIFREKATDFDLHLAKITHVVPTPNAEIKRELMCFRHEKSIIEENRLVIELSRHNYTSEYIALTKNFYLKF